MPTLQELRVFARLHLKQRAYDWPAPDEDMDVVPLGYEPDAFAAAVQAFADRYDVEEVGRVAYRSTSRPIFRIRSRADRPAARLLVLSGVHGNEQAGIVCVPEILERFPGDGRVALEILTPVNAVGAAELSRFNADGYDINRDFVRFRTAEARLVRQAIEDHRPDFVVSLHEGPQDAAFLFANRHVDGALARRLLARLEGTGTALADKDYFGLPLRPPGLSASTPVQRAILRLWSGTLRMMAANEYASRRGIPEVTLESSWRSPDKAARVQAHVALTLGLAEELASLERH